MFNVLTVSIIAKPVILTDTVVHVKIYLIVPVASNIPRDQLRNEENNFPRQ